MSSSLSRDVTICVICGFKNAIRGFDFCEDCLPIVAKQAKALADKALDASELMAKKLKEILDEPEKYRIDEAKRKEIEKTLRFMADENENTRQKLRSAKKQDLS